MKIAWKQKGKRVRRYLKEKPLVVVISVLLVVSVATTSYFFLQYQSLKGHSQETSEQKTQRLVEKIGEVYALPNETPTVATITDKQKLQKQTFFKDAQDGDQLLIFTKAKLAILYRESTNKLINVGPIGLSEGETAADEAK